MSNITGALKNAGEDVIAYGIGFTQAIGKTVGNCNTGLLWFADGTSKVLYRMYSLEGIEKVEKLIVADFDTITWLFRLNTGTFAKANKAFNEQRKFLYATKIIEDVVNILAGKAFTIQAKLLTIGNFLDTCKYLKDNNIIAFGWFSKQASVIGSVRVYAGLKFDNGKVWAYSARIEEIPLIGNILSAPKEIFIFTASLFDLRDIYREGVGTLDYKLKLVATIGKIGLLTLSNNTAIGREPAFCLLNFVTQNASFIRFAMDGFKKEEEHFRPSRKDVLKV